MKKLSTGVRSSIDIGRLSKAVSRPGVDPRVWITLAVVLEVAYDEKEGVFADVQTIPDGDYLTCYVGSPYAGDGFGTLYPPKVEEIVLVAVPQGDYNIGPVIFSRLHTGQAPPPSEFQNPDGTEATSAVEEPVTVVEPSRTMKIVARDGASIRLEVEGSGKVEIAATGAAQVEVTGENAIIVNSPDVRLGDSAGNGVARIGDIVVSSCPALVVGPGPAAGSTVIPLVPTALTPTGGTTCVGQITSGKNSVKA